MQHITVQVIDKISELEQIRSDWNNLIRDCGENSTIYLTPEWITARWKHFGSDSRLNVVAVRRDGNLIGLFPLKKTLYSQWWLKFEALETIGAVNCNHVGLFKNADCTEVMKVFFEYIHEEISSKNTITKFELVPEDCAFHRLLRPVLQNFSGRLDTDETRMSIAPYISLSSGWHEYFQSLTPSRRRRIRKILSRSKKGPATNYRQFNQENLDTGLSKLFEIHQKRWQAVNIKSQFSYSQFREFYRDIASAFLKNGWLHFSCITVNGEIGSAIFAFIFNGKFYAVTAGRDPEYADLNLGHLHCYYLIQDGFSRNLKEFDFLQGDEPYKFYWTRHSRKYNRLLLIKHTPFSSAYLLFLKAFFRTVQIKRNRHSRREIVALLCSKLKNHRLRKELFRSRSDKKRQPEKS